MGGFGAAGRSGRLCAICAGLFWACGGGATSDDGDDRDASFADASTPWDALPGLVDVPLPQAPSPPRPPRRPELPECRTGWREAQVAGSPYCVPWPETGHERCGPGQAHLPGDPGCRRIGPPCPVDGFPSGPLPTERVVYLLAGARGGDGSRERPFGRLSEVDFDALPDDTTVALGVGTYADPLEVLERDLFIVGACTERTRIEVRDGERQPAVLLGSQVPSLASVTISASDRPALVVAGGRGRITRARVRSVIVEDVDTPGVAAVAVEGFASVDARELVIRRVRGLGMQVGLERAGASVVDGLVSTTLGVGVIVADGAYVSFENVAVVGVAPFPDAEGSGVQVQTGGFFDSFFTVIDGAAAYGVTASGRGSTARFLNGALVRTRRSGVEPAFGARAVAGGSVQGFRTWSADHAGGGWLADGEGSQVRSLDGWIFDNRSLGSGRFGYGVWARNGGQAELQRVIVQGNSNGAIVAESGGTVRANDVDVRATVAAAVDDAAAGTALRVETGTAALRRVRISASDGAGVRMTGFSSRLEAVDLRVETSTDGIVLEDGVVQGRRWSISRVAGRGLMVDRGVAVIDDLEVERTAAGRSGLGDGVVILEAASLASSHLQVFDSDRCALRSTAVAPKVDFDVGQLFDNEVAVCAVDEAAELLLSAFELSGNGREWMDP